jgi:hypothetical protein
MPTNNGLRLDDRQRIPDTGRQPVQADEYQSAEAGEEKPTRRGPPQDVDLVAQDKVLCCNRRSRSKQPHHRRPDQPD